MLRMNGTGSTISASKPIATVTPLNTTACPAVLHRDHNRVVIVAAVVALLAPARDEQQRVVDSNAEPDQRDEELHDERHIGQVGDRQQHHERRENRHRGDQERQQREEGREHECEDDERADPAEQRLAEDSRTAVVAATGRQRVLAGHSDRRARRLGLLDRAPDRLGQQVLAR